MRALSYGRVSTAEQGVSGAGLEAQRSAIADEVERRGWVVVDYLEDSGYSAKNLKRPAIQDALTRLRRHEADALVVAKLDRLSRSLLDFTSLMAQAQRQGWAVVCLDMQVDTTTPAGEAMASVLATFAQFERRLIGQRTKDALAVKRSQGVQLGRPRVMPADVVARIVHERGRGRTLAAIAGGLNDDGVGTAHGGVRWYPATVRAVLGSAERSNGLDAVVIAAA